jgi:hypothetical protein
MNKNQKVLLGVAVVGVAGYFYWKSKQPKAAFVRANLAGNASKAGFLAGDVKQMGTKAGVSYPKGGQFLAGAVQPLGGQGTNFKGFANQKTSGDAQFATFTKVNMGGTARNIPTEAVNTNPVLNPFFKVKGAHVGTPKLWAKEM